MACSVMQPLLLQKPCKQSKAKDHAHHLSRRLDLRKKGSLDELMNECCCIQNRLKSTHPESDKSRDVARLFDHLLSEGKFGTDLHLLIVTHKGGVLPLDSLVPSGSDSLGSPLFKTTTEILQEKHPRGRAAIQDSLLDPSIEDPCFDPILFDQLDNCLIRQTALLADVSNAFNSVNHQAALHNISILCPALSMVLHNT